MNELTEKLIVDAGHPAIRIEVLDANYQVQAKGYGKIEQELPTGFYTVQYKAAAAILERDVTLRPGRPVTIKDPPDLRFASAAPLSLTSTSHEYHQGHAVQLSQEEPLSLGQGSRIFLFVRDVEPGGHAHPAQGLSLHTITGEQLVAFNEVIETSKNTDLALSGGRNLAVDPGFYRLRLTLRRGKAIEMMIPACPNWQSQVFLLRQGGENEFAGRTVLDLPNASQLMAFANTGFNPWNYPSTQNRVHPTEVGEDLRLIELARQALSNGYRGIRSADLRDMLWGKWRDPILGILGLYLLLQQPEPDLDLAEMVIGRLRMDILSGFRHPDIDALELKVAHLRGKPIEIAPIEAPPMLRQSWNILVQATATKPELIPPDSFISQIADRLWGASAWLIWEVPPETPTKQSGEKKSGSSLGKLSASEDLIDNIRIGIQPLFNSSSRRKTSKAHGLERFEKGVDQGAETLEENTGVESSEVEPEISETRPEDFPLNEIDFNKLCAVTQNLLADSEHFQGKRSEQIARKLKLDSVEYALLGKLLEQNRSQKRSYQTPREPLSLQVFISQLGLPAGSIQAALVRLSDKLRAI